MHKETFQKHDLNGFRGSDDKIAKKIKKTNFQFGTDRDRHNQTTQQFNQAYSKRCNTARSSAVEKPVLDRDKIQATQFKMGFLSPEYKITSTEYTPPPEGVTGHKILEKGKGKDNSHNFTYGNTRVTYTSSNTESYRQIDLKDVPQANGGANMHGSHFAEQQKRIHELEQSNKKNLTQTQNLGKISKLKQSYTPRQNHKFAQNLRKTHFTFGGSNEFKERTRKSVSPYLQGFQRDPRQDQNAIARFVSLLTIP
jgi:hypothetical protein